MPQGFAARPQIPPSTKPSSPPKLSNPSSLNKSKQEDAFGEKRPQKEPCPPPPTVGTAPAASAASRAAAAPHGPAARSAWL